MGHVVLPGACPLGKNGGIKLLNLQLPWGNAPQCSGEMQFNVELVKTKSHFDFPGGKFVKIVQNQNFPW